MNNQEIKILLVDDREDNLFSIQTLLERDGYTFVKAISGKQALKILLKEQNFTLILMDVQMPELNGLETAALIYEREKLRHIPIIFITAFDQSEELVFKGYKTGAVDYLYKPLNPQLLRAKVAVFVELYKKTHALIAQEQKLIAINKSLEDEILERKKSEAMLSEAQRMTHLGSWEWNIRKDEIVWSDELYRIFGYEPGSVKSSFKLLLNHCHPEDLSNISAIIRNACYSKEAFSFEHRIIQVNGQLRTIYGKGRTITDERSGEVKMIGSVLDITDIKDTQEQLKQKDAFISIASHELKTPLTSIKAYNELLHRCLEDENTEQAKNYAKKNIIYISKLQNLITDLLNVSKIQAGKLEFNITEFDFDEMMHETIENIQLISGDYNIVLQGQTEAFVKGDRERLEQVIINYLSNAIKYSPSVKEIIVNLSRDKNHITISVKDFGIGIPKDKQSQIFERFFRIENSSQKFSGLGLGLYISSEIVKNHNGKTWVESEEGKGSTFHITLPLVTKLAIH